MRNHEILKKVIMYIDKVAIAYEKIKGLEESELLETETSYALTQYLTNIYELINLVDDDELSSKLVFVGSKSLKTCRNISSHDYDSLDWIKVKMLCKKLLSPNSKQILNECYQLAINKDKSVKDYTKLINNLI